MQAPTLIFGLQASTDYFSYKKYECGGKPRI